MVNTEDSMDQMYVHAMQTWYPTSSPTCYRLLFLLVPFNTRQKLHSSAFNLLMSFIINYKLIVQLAVEIWTLIEFPGQSEVHIRIVVIHARHKMLHSFWQYITAQHGPLTPKCALIRFTFCIQFTGQQ